MYILYFNFYVNKYSNQLFLFHLEKMYFCHDSYGVFLALVVAGSLQKSDMWKTLCGLLLE